MAYSTTIPKHDCRQPGCHARATHELFNARNASCGYYCTRHIKHAVADLDRLWETAFVERTVDVT